MRMRSLHAGETSSDGVGKGRGLARIEIDVEHHVLGGGRKPALLRMEELLEMCIRLAS